MIINSISTILTRDLNKLKTEISAYKDESRIWVTEESISNSAGNLCLHLIGNLNTFIGKELGGTGYVRNRDLEFSLKNVPRKELVQKIEETLAVVNKALLELPPSDLEKDYPVLVFEQKMSTMYFLIHLTAHLSYHLGQINYHRRLLDRIS